jgi:hypothetical protein
MKRLKAPTAPVLPHSVRHDLASSDVEFLRADLARVLKGAMPSFRNYVINGKGSENWSMTRLKAFQIALSRVVPEITQTRHDINITEKKVHELTVAELEQIAASGIAEKKLEPSGWFDQPKSEIVDAQVIEEVQAGEPADEALLQRQLPPEREACDLASPGSGA